MRARRRTRALPARRATSSSSSMPTTRFSPSGSRLSASWLRLAPDLDILTSDAFLEVDGKVVRRCYEAGWTFEVHDQRGAILDGTSSLVLPQSVVRAFSKAAVSTAPFSMAPTRDLWCRMVLNGSRVGLVDEPLARYRLRPSSLSADRVALLEGRCRVLERAASRDDLTPGSANARAGRTCTGAAQRASDPGDHCAPGRLP